MLIKMAMGKTRMGTANVKTAGHPTLNQIIILPPNRPKGNIKPASTKGSLVSIELKSLLSRLVILPSYAALAAKEVSLDTFANSKNITPARILQDIIGME
jgi:hypothetical protein